jgi:hypothetical protein
MKVQPTTKDEALKLALEALEQLRTPLRVNTALDAYDVSRAITAIKQALAAPAQGCDFCKHPLYAGTTCKNCGREPAPVQEPVGYLFQHEETGLTTVVDVQQVEWGFEKNNPRHQKIGPVYTTPPAAQRQWGGLTRWEIDAKLKEKNT